MAAKIASRIPAAPDLPEINKLKVVSTISLDDNIEIESAHVENANFNGAKATRIAVRESLLHELNMTDSVLDFVELTDVVIRESDLANAAWNWFAANRALFLSCRLLGFKAIESEIISTKFESCQMELAQFRFSKLAGCYFEDCILRDADFSGADLTGATFEHCDLTGASFSAAKCRGLDLRSSTMEGVVVGPVELAGVIINPSQAADLVKVFGITVLNIYDPIPKEKS